ncbi:hypothetical protein SEUCBS139899_006446 [Sporothrix eucalyptigena]|uniref:Acid phosphatase n=1 Tax=Sporothrix eucalyptigena TaxID=1812306 RepID=A0ABP0BMF5_9PEZI
MDDDTDGHLADPTLTLTLPSIHDGTPLDCRIYLPPSILALASTGSATSSARRWHGNAAIMAHPYAPMGGSYNDPIVKMVTQTLLHPSSSLSSEFVVATFNFRGAGRKPQGRTSWTAKPETGDYMTIAGFLYYFTHYLDPYGEKEAPKEVTSATSSSHVSPTLLFAGYSYGAMVTTLLPPLATILGFFARPLRGSPAAEVRLRAARWAAIQNADFAALRDRLAAEGAYPSSPTRGSPSKTRLSMGVRVGAADDDGHWRRKSHEASLSSGPNSTGGSLRQMLSPSSPRRSMSADRRHSGNGHANSHARSNSSNDAMAFGDDKDGSGSQRGAVAGWMARVRHAGKEDDAVETDKNDKGEDTLPVVSNLPTVRPAYLLISPPVGFATNLATMSFGAVASGVGIFKKRKGTPTAASPAPIASAPTTATAEEESSAAADEAGHSQEESSDKLASNPTLVIYGDADGFVSAKKMRQWTASLTAASAVTKRPLNNSVATQPKTLFEAREVPTAGHFWSEGRTYYELQEAVAAFAAEVGKK